MAQTAITPDFVQRACALGPIALASSPWARWRAARPGRSRSSIRRPAGVIG